MLVCRFQQCRPIVLPFNQFRVLRELLFPRGYGFPHSVQLCEPCHSFSQSCCKQTFRLLLHGTKLQEDQCANRGRQRAAAE